MGSDCAMLFLHAVCNIADICSPLWLCLAESSSITLPCIHLTVPRKNRRRQTDRQTQTQRDKDKQMERERERQREREREREREAETKSETEKDTR